MNNKFTLISTILNEQVLLEKERRKRRKKPVFYYNRDRGIEKHLVERYKASLEKERKEKDPKKKMAVRLITQQIKNRLEQVRIQMRIKKNIKHLQSF